MQYLGIKASKYVISASILAITSFSQTTYAQSVVGSYAGVNSHTAVNSLPNDYLENTTGASLELSATGAGSYSLSNRNSAQPGFTQKQYSDNVYAKASLQTGELKTKASFGFGANEDFTGAPIQSGKNNGSASATAGFSDVFNTYSGNTPYLWSDGSAASFNFAVSGNASIPSGLVARNDNLGSNTKNLIFTSLNLYVAKTGAREISNQIESLRPNLASAIANKDEIDALQAIYDSYQIVDKTWVLGEHLMAPSNTWEKVVLDENGTANISFQFTPNSDFEWSLSLESVVFLDASLENTEATLDFSHTIKTSYTGPDGTTTISASGLFPTSAPLSSVPVPAAVWLFGSGLFGLTGLRRKVSA
jgi:hypothetical protein